MQLIHVYLIMTVKMMIFIHMIHSIPQSQSIHAHAAATLVAPLAARPVKTIMLTIRV